MRETSHFAHREKDRSSTNGSGGGRSARHEPVVRWRQQKHADYLDSETWFARYRGWTLYAGNYKQSNTWHATLHRFTDDGMADNPRCHETYGSLEGAQNAAEFYAEHERFPHAGLPSA